MLCCDKSEIENSFGLIPIIYKILFQAASRSIVFDKSKYIGIKSPSFQLRACLINSCCSLILLPLPTSPSKTNT